MLGGVKGRDRTEGLDEKAGCVNSSQDATGFSNTDITQHNIA